METFPFNRMQLEEIMEARIHSPFVIAPQSFLGTQEITAIAVAIYESENQPTQQNEQPQSRWWLRHFMSERR